LGVGAVVLRHLERPQTVTILWDKVRDERVVGTYERFILALNLLHIIGMVNLSQGMIQREAS
jgi:ABC-three component (ABC-3C) system Middle Component 6